MSTYQETIIDLMRHGEPIGGKMLRGSQDDPLTDDGWQQMSAAIGEHCPWASIVSSPLRRCAEFAKTVAERTRLPYQEVPGFQEINFGRWEGLTPDQVMTAFPGELEAYWRDPTRFYAPEGEALEQFMGRVDESWNHLLKSHLGQHVLLVCHGGVIRAVLNKILEMPFSALWRIEVPYANITRIRVTHFDDYPDTSNLVFHQAQL